MIFEKQLPLARASRAIHNPNHSMSQHLAECHPSLIFQHAILFSAPPDFHATSQRVSHLFCIDKCIVSYVFIFIILYMFYSYIARETLLRSWTREKLGEKRGKTLKAGVFAEEAHKLEDAGAGCASGEHETQRMNDVLGFETGGLDHLLCFLI